MRVSGLAPLPGANRYFRYLAPFYPRAFESFDLRGYDTVISTTTSWSKGVIVPPPAIHVCYINTVSRFAFAYDDYVGAMTRNGPLGIASGIARPIVARLVDWDRRAAARPSALVANSRNVAERVERYYGRRAYVLHAPVDLHRFTVGEGRGDYFLVVSRLLPYKRIEVAIEACSRAGVPLRIVGTGPAESALRAAARGTDTTFLGALGDAALDALVGDARAVIVPGEEDFGLVAVEAAAAGRATIAFGRGGALETIKPEVTGTFFDGSSEGLAAALARHDPERFERSALRRHAETFATQQFIARLLQIVAEVRLEGSHPPEQR